MPAIADHADADDQVIPVLNLHAHAIEFVLAALLHHATVKIVPVVSLLLNLMENVSPSARSRAEP